MNRSLTHFSSWLTLSVGFLLLTACDPIVIPPQDDVISDQDGGAETNVAPTIETPADPVVSEGVPVTLQLSATDPNEGQVLTWSVSGKPAGADFNTVTGAFSWTPSYFDITYLEVQKDYALTFVVSDDGDPVLQSEVTVQIRVLNDEDEDGVADQDDDDIDGDGLSNAEEEAAGTEPHNADTDGDNIKDNADNCPLAANSGQQDADGDGRGDACDDCPTDGLDDADGDGHCADNDNCPEAANADQADGDGDGLGDLCDACLNDAFNDFDVDGLCGDVDNCPNASNPDQTDGDGDGAGDACDSCPADPINDSDSDGVCGDVDNCPDLSNQSQLDTDGDGLGDACDTCDGPGTDSDEDGVCDDNCPNTKNSNQLDGDGDGFGDACDPCPSDDFNDADGDGFCADVDNCAGANNPGQEDGDSDGFGDACDICVSDAENDIDGDNVCGDVDNCPGATNPDQLNTDGLEDGGDACDDDDDEDGASDLVDNCPSVANLDQADQDLNGVGDACDDDNDGDGVGNDVDNCVNTANPSQADLDGDGIGTACDGQLLADEGAFGSAWDGLTDAHAGSVVAAVVGDAGKVDLLVVEGASKAAYTSLEALGLSLHQAFVGSDGLSYVTTFDASDYITMQLPVDAPSILLAQEATPPMFWRAPGSRTLLGLEAGLFVMGNAASMTELSAGEGFVDDSGEGAQWGGETLYIPVSQANGTELLAFTSDGLTHLPLSGGDVHFLAEKDEILTYCFDTGTSVSLRLLSGGSVLSTLTLPNAANCADFEVFHNAISGKYFFDYKTKSGAQHELARWSGSGQLQVILANGGNEATFHGAGAKTYIVLKDNSQFTTVRDGDTSTVLMVATQLYYVQASGSASGHFGLAGSTKASGTGRIRAFTTDGSVTQPNNLLGSAFTSSIVSKVTMDESGLLWIEFTFVDGVSKRYLGYFYRDSTGFLVKQGLFLAASQSSSVTSFEVGGSAATLISVDGVEQGIRSASFDGTTVNTQLLSAAAGTHTGFLPDEQMVLGESAWVLFKDGVSSWSVASFDGVTLSVQANGLAGTPSEVYRDPNTGVPWFKLDTGVSQSFVSLFADGTLNQWQVNQDEVSALKVVEHGQETLWGTLSKPQGQPRRACEVGTNTCYDLPGFDFFFLAPAAVSNMGEVHALIQNAINNEVTLWRSGLDD